MGVVFTNNAETTLAAAITSTSATSISVTSSSTFPAIQAGEHFYATLDDGTNNEIVKVTGVSGTTWTVVRASDSTTARTFANGITVQLRATAALLTDIQENIAAKSANQTVYNATAASNATAYDVGVNPGVEANAMVFLDGVMQHHDTFSFSGSTLTFDAAPTNGTKIEVIVDNLINLQSSNLTTDTFTATSGQTAFTLSDAPAAENNLIVFIDGVFQDQGNYSISNHTLTLATGAVVGRTVTVYIINPVNIGTPSDGTVTSAKLSGNITMPGTLTVGAFDVAFDSPTFFVDNANSRVGLGTSTPSVPVDIVGEVKISSHLNMPDNAKAKFGTGSDLQIYHDGSNSWIKDEGTGVLAITTNGNGIGFYDSAGAEPMLFATKDNSVDLYFNGSKKLGTTNTGIDVTGVITQQTPANTDSILTVDSTSTNVSQRLNLSANGTIQTQLYDDASQTKLFAVTNKPLLLGTNNTTAITIDTSQNVGIGVVPSAWGANYAAIQSVQGLGLWTTRNAPATILGSNAYNANEANDRYVNSNFASKYTQTGGIHSWYIAPSGTAGNAITYSEAMRITDGGDVSIGSDHAGFTGYRVLNLRGGSTGGIYNFENSSGTRTASVLNTGSDLRLQTFVSGGSIIFEPEGTERMRIDSSGVVDITGGTLKLASGANRKLFYRSANNDVILESASGLFYRQDIGNTNHSWFTGNSERMRIASTGNILVGTTLRCFLAKQVVYATGSGASTITQNLWNGGGSGCKYVQFVNSSGMAIGTITQNGASAISYNTSSDYRLKENVDYDFTALDRVAQLKPARFNFIADADNTVDGFLAHEVQDIVPEAITGKKDAVREEEYEVTPAVLDDDGNVVTEAEMGTREVPDYQGIDQSKLVPLLTKAIQEQQTVIDDLKTRIEALEG